MIYQNAVKIVEGGKITYLPSLFRHDFRTYTFEDGTEYSVDGGLDYLRRIGSFPAKGEGRIEDFSLTDKDSESEIIMKALWGTLGKESSVKLAFYPIVTLGLDHVKAIWRDYAGNLGKAQFIAIKARLRLSNKQVEKDIQERKANKIIVEYLTN